MARASLNEVIPGKLYQRGQFLTWPHPQKWRLLEEYKITLVVNLWSKVDPDLSTNTHGRVYLNWVCSPSEVPENADLLIGIVASAIEQGFCALIHCEAGRGRSVWLSGKVLAEVENLAGKEALSRIEKAVPGHNLTDTLMRDLLSK